MSRDTTVIAFRQPDNINDPLTELAREGARRMLAQVLVAEADAFVAMWKDFDRRFSGQRPPGHCQVAFTKD